MDDPRKRNSRLPFILTDVLHIVLGAAIPILAVFIFISPERRVRLFPLLFFGCGLMSIVNGVYLIQHLQRGRKKYGGILVQFFLAAVFFAMSYITGRAVL